MGDERVDMSAMSAMVTLESQRFRADLIQVRDE